MATADARRNILKNIGNCWKPLGTVVGTIEKQMGTVETVNFVVEDKGGGLLLQN